MKKQKATFEWHKTNAERIKNVKDAILEIREDTNGIYQFDTIRRLNRALREIILFEGLMEDRLCNENPDIEINMNVYSNRKTK